MSGNLLESIGLGGLDIAYVLIGMIAFMLLLLILVIVQFAGMSKLKKKYNRFMMGKDGQSMEEEITGLYDENSLIREESKKNRKEINLLKKRMEFCYQKLGLVKYDAFNQMGGQLSFSIALLDEKNDGFILNSVHSSEGCYTYTKEIRGGECEITLGDEERKALDKAVMGN